MCAAESEAIRRWSKITDSYLAGEAVEQAEFSGLFPHGGQQLQDGAKVQSGDQLDEMRN